MPMWTELETVEALEQCFARTGRSVLLFKHSTRCPLSAMAKSRIENGRDEALDYFLIDVIRHREVSQKLAEKTEIRHESPQAFLVCDGEVETVKSHTDIRPSAFALNQ